MSPHSGGSILLPILERRELEAPAILLPILERRELEAPATLRNTTLLRLPVLDTQREGQRLAVRTPG